MGDFRFYTGEWNYKRWRSWKEPLTLWTPRADKNVTVALIRMVTFNTSASSSRQMHVWGKNPKRSLLTAGPPAAFDLVYSRLMKCPFVVGRLSVSNPFEMEMRRRRLQRGTAPAARRRIPCEWLLIIKGQKATFLRYLDKMTSHFCSRRYAVSLADSVHHAGRKLFPASGLIPSTVCPCSWRENRLLYDENLTAVTFCAGTSTSVLNLICCMPLKSLLHHFSLTSSSFCI